MDVLQVLDHRRSTPSRLLSEPGPDPAQLQRMLAAAVRVPDHGRLQPWRFILIRGDNRKRLGDVLARRSVERNPDAIAAVVDKDRARFCQAPLVIAVIARLTPGHKVPEFEQLLSGGAVCLALLQAADALGFGAQWLTGWAAYDSVVATTLGLSGNEKVLGFIHVGTAREPVAERERPDPATLTRELQL
ncbi:MAG: nitroreductase [Gammaproteobacteria bacterium]|nr:nitroreductase [Gammaproteobacteria bacterium]